MSQENSADPETSASHVCDMGQPEPESQTKPEDELLSKRPKTATKPEDPTKAAPTHVGQFTVGMVSGALLSPCKAWSVSAVRGKVTDRCLWSVCKAMTLGVVLIATGAGMATIGYYSDSLSTVSERRGNETVMVKNESRDSHLNSLTYLGPVVMGVGGFIIVAACVMTFEARDTAAKIVPVWFKKTRAQVVPGSSCSNASGTSSRTSWERFLVQGKCHLPGTRIQQSKPPVESKHTRLVHKEYRTSVNDSLLTFSKYIQSSIDSGKFSPNANRPPGPVSQLRKCPSEPTLYGMPVSESASKLQEAATKPPEEEGILKEERHRNRLALPTNRQRDHSPNNRSMLLNLKLQRQSVSVDCQNECSRPIVSLQNQLVTKSTNTDVEAARTSLLVNPSVNAECSGGRYASSNSMAMDLYLPQGSFTLKIKDDKKTNCTSNRGVRSGHPSVGRAKGSFEGVVASKSLSRESSRSSGAAQSPGSRTPGHRTPNENSPSFPRTPTLSRNSSGSTDSTKRHHSPKHGNNTDEPDSHHHHHHHHHHRKRTDSVNSNTSSNTPTRHLPEGTSTSHKSLKDTAESSQSSTMKRHPLTRQRALENKQDTDSNTEKQ